jgi:hypothetical protein
MKKNTKSINSIKAQEKRKKLLKDIPNTLRERQKDLVRIHFKNECAITGKYDIAFDHFIPVGWGAIVRKYGIGGTTYANMIILDKSINSSKSSWNPFLWFERYGERHNISIEKWNMAVEYIAEKHGMTSYDYRNQVNACHSEIIAIRWIAHVNQSIESNGRVHPVNISNALRANLNITTVVEMFGNTRIKEAFLDNETIKLINEKKNWLESRLN